MKDQKNNEPKAESQSFFEKVETASVQSVSSAIAAQIALKIKQVQDNTSSAS